MKPDPDDEINGILAAGLAIALGCPPSRLHEVAAYLHDQPAPTSGLDAVRVFGRAVDTIVPLGHKEPRYMSPVTYTTTLRRRLFYMLFLSTMFGWFAGAVAWQLLPDVVWTAVTVVFTIGMLAWSLLFARRR